MTRIVRALAVGMAVVLLAGCIGATTRDEFEAEVRARGGGLTVEFLIDSLDVVAADVGAGSWRDLDVLSLRARPRDRTLVVVVRRPDRPDFVDTVSVRDGDIVASVPVQDAGDLPLDALVVGLDTVALDRIEDIGAEALRVFDEDGGFVEAVIVTRAGTDVTLSVDVESDRRTATVVFEPDGALRGIE